MRLQENQQFHLGVYGVYVRDDEVLVIKKSKGPYKGLYDLPGGRIEHGENVEETLEREFAEEIGISHLQSKEFLGYNEYFCTFTNDAGEIKDFHHIGLYFKVTLYNGHVIKAEADGHDSLGASFIPVADLGLHNCSQIAFEMLQK